MTCMLLGEDAIRKLGSVGKVIPTVAARVVDEEMNDVPVGQVGEIVYRAPTLMAGYWNNPEATAEAFAGGWFHSGDLVRQDDEGYVWVVDRKKDMIISGGENIYCAEVENVLAAHPAIAEVGGDRPARTRSGARCPSRSSPWRPMPADESDAWPNSTNSSPNGSRDTSIRRRSEIVDALPRNPAGKVLKTELRSRFGAPNVRLTPAKVLLLQRFLPTAAEGLTCDDEFASGYGLNPADAVHAAGSIGYCPVVRLTTHE